LPRLHDAGKLLVVRDFPSHGDGPLLQPQGVFVVQASRVHSTTESCVGEPLATPSVKGLLPSRAWADALRGK
jgi:hypothetical protein